MGGPSGSLLPQPRKLVQMSAERRGLFKASDVVDLAATDASLEFRFGRDCAMLNLGLDAVGAADSAPSASSTRWVDMVLRQCDAATIRALASGAPSFELKLRERAGAGSRELGTLTEMVSWSGGGAMVFVGAGKTHVACFAPEAGEQSDPNSFFGAAHAQLVPPSMASMAAAMRFSLSAVVPAAEGASLATTSDLGTVVLGGRTIGESALSDSTRRVVVDRDGKPLMYVPGEGGAKWWIWVIVACAAAIVLGGALLAMRARKRPK